MKLQNLAIIFIAILIPILVILSYYLDLQQKTLEMQASYDLKLSEATKESIRAFEINTVDWSNKRLNTRETSKAMVNTFLTSLGNNLNISGTAKEYMVNYIPALVITLYDGYYIYSPSYMPIPIESEEGVQLFYNEGSREITSKEKNADGTSNLVIYEPKSDKVSGCLVANYVSNEIIKENIKFVTEQNIQNAKKDYKHILNNETAYSSRYKNNNLDVIINYTLDNKITIYGQNNDDKSTINKERISSIF